MRLLVALALLLAFAAPATAATADLHVDAWGAPLPPIAGVRTVGGNATVSCLLAENGTGAPVVFSAHGPAYARVTVSPSIVFPEGDCDGPWTAAVRIAVGFTAEAPALRSVPIEVSARVANATEEATANATILAVPAFFSILDVSAAETIRMARPQSVVEFPLTVSNSGNGRTKVLFEIVEAPDGVSAPVPMPVIVGARGEGDSNVTVPFTVMAPWRTGYLNEVGTFTLQATSHLALDPKEKGDVTMVSVILTTRGFYMPATPVVAVLAAAAIAVALCRRAL